MYNTNSKIKFKTTMLRSSLCDHSDAYILVKRTISITAQAGSSPNNDKKVVFKNCAPFTDCISEINNTQVDNAEYIDVVMPMYNLIEYSNIYSKKSGSLWQYYRGELALTNVGFITSFHASNNSASFKFRQKITGAKGNKGTENVEIMVSLMYLGNFWRTLEMSLINCEINLILTWSDKCVLCNDTKATTFAITDTKLYVPVVTLSTQDNVKLLEQLKTGYKRTIYWKKYEPKVSTETENSYLDFLINSIFQGVNRFYVLSFENKGDRTVHTKYYLPTVEIKDYNVMMDGIYIFDQEII